MKIVIPSHARSHKMVTWGNLPPAVRELTHVAVYPDEAGDYGPYPKLILPRGIRGIANKRNWILEQAYRIGYKYLMILDDDLQFAVRRQDNLTKFRPAEPEDIVNMVMKAEEMLSRGYIHGGISPREGANRDVDTYRFNTRVMRAHFFNTHAVIDAGVRLNEIPYMSDFDTTLTLLEEGYENVVLNNWVTNQAGSNTEGGCSTDRDLSKLADAAYALKARHPQFVTVVDKTTKTSWGGGTRKDVRIQWKKAYQSSQS